MILIITVSVVLQFLVVYYALKFRDFREESLTWIAVASGFFILALWNSVTLLQIFLRTLTSPVDPVSELITFAFSGFVFGGLYTHSKKDNLNTEVTEEHMIKSLNNPSSLFQNSPFSIIVAEKLSGLIVAANKTACSMFGYEMKEMVGSPVSLIYPPESKRQYTELIRSDADSKQDFINNFFAVDKAGSRFPIEISSSINILDKRELIHNVIRDVSSRQKTERELEYRSVLLNKITDTVIAHDFSGNIFYANESAYATRGYTEEELLAMNLNDFITDENKKEFPKRIRDLMDRGPTIFRSTHTRKDGTTFEVEVSPKLIEHENGKAIISVIRDITDLRKYEDEIQFKSFLTDEINDSIFVHDFEGNIEFVNKVAFETLGYTKEELLAKNIMDLVRPDQVKQLNKNLDIIKESEALSVSLINYKKDSSPIDCEVRAKLIDYNGKKAIASVVRDVTEKKEFQTESTFKSNLVDKIRDSVFVHDLEGNFLYINKSAHEDRGYTKDELMSLNLGNLVTPDIKTKLKLNFDTILEKGALTLESKHYKKDGEVINCQVNASVIDYKGQKVIASVVRDVGDLNLLSMLAESANDSIFVHDNKNIYFANEAAYSSRGYSKEEFLALRIDELLEEGQKELLYARWGKVISGQKGNIDFDSVHKKRDGTLFPVEVRSKIIDYRGQDAALSICRDVSQRHLAMSQLRASEENYRQLSDATDDNVLIIDDNFIYTYVNDAAAKRFNHPRDEFIGKKIEEVLPPQVAEIVTSQIKAVIESNEIKSYQSEIKTDKGTTFLSTKMIPLADDLGNVKSVLTVARDFTDVINAKINAKQAEDKYRILIDLANDAVFIADAKTGIIIDANQSASLLVKKPIQQIIGMHQMELHPPEESDNYRKIFQEHIEKERGVVGDIFAIDSLGHQIPIEISSSIMEIDGKPIIMGIFRDVSSRARTNELNETLNNINSTLHSHLDIDDRLTRILKLSSEKLLAKSAIILIKGNDNWSISDSYNVSGLKLGTRFSNEDAKCATFVAANNEPMVVDDIKTDPLANEELLGEMGVKSLFAAPLIMKGKTFGILNYYFESSPLPIDQVEKDFILKLSTSMGLAIENASLYDTEAGIANTLQEALLKMPEHIHGGIFGHVYRSASKAAKVGGDFHDIFELEHNKIGLIMGDVSGKGLGAASLTTLIKNSIRAATYDYDDPSMVISKVNDIVTNMTDEYMFVTVFFAIVEVVTGDITYCLAGHPPPIVRKNDGDLEYLQVTSPPIGVMKGLDFNNGSSKLDKDDILINYTDGLIEARHNDEFFGEERLEKLIKKSVSNSVKDLPQAILKAVEKFSAYNLSDDLAILTFQINHYSKE